MPTFSTTNHALQFGNNTPTVTIVGTDTDGYIIYDMSTSGTFYQFAPNTKYFAIEVIFDVPFVISPGVIINAANPNTAGVLTANPGLEFFVDQNDVTTSYFKISGISSSTPLLGPQVLIWSYQVGGQQVGMGGGGTVTSVATDSTLTGGPITTSGTLGINLAHANTWTATQTFSGVTFSSFTQGSVPFVGSGGTFSQDNANLFWDSTHHRLGIGTNSPDAYMTIQSASQLTGNLLLDLNAPGGLSLILDDGMFMRILGSASWGSGLTIGQFGVAQTINSGLMVEGTQAATLGNQEWSPAMVFRGNGYRTSGTTGSYTADISQYMKLTNDAIPRGIMAFTERAAGSGTMNDIMYIDYSGSITLGGNTTSSSIQFSAGSSATVSAANTGKIRYNDSTHVFEQSLNGAAYTALGGGGVTGPRVIPAGFPANSVLGTPTVVGAIQFNPADYAGYTTIKYRTVFANGNNAVSTSVKLRDVTTGVDIYTTTYSGSTADQVQEVTLSLGTPGANTIANSAKIYEVSIFVNSPVTGGTNFIQLYSAEFRVA